MSNQQLRLLQLNDVRMVGRLTRDPELRFTAKGAAVCRFDLAVNRRYKDTASGEWKDDTSFIPCVAWRETGQRVGEKLKKGAPVYVEGRLKSRAWETKDGQKRTGIEVDAARVQFLERLGGDTEGGSEEMPAGEGASAPVLGAAAPADEEVPF
jgi:single-strand DNA-binding protein